MYEPLWISNEAVKQCVRVTYEAWTFKATKQNSNFLRHLIKNPNWTVNNPSSSPETYGIYCKKLIKFTTSFLDYILLKMF